jgi:hypothetical protein
MKFNFNFLFILITYVKFSITHLCIYLFASIWLIHTKFLLHMKITF